MVVMMTKLIRLSIQQEPTLAVQMEMEAKGVSMSSLCGASLREIQNHNTNREGLIAEAGAALRTPSDLRPLWKST